jgi:hypothetical protein
MARTYSLPTTRPAGSALSHGTRLKAPHPRRASQRAGGTALRRGRRHQDSPLRNRRRFGHRVAMVDVRQERHHISRMPRRPPRRALSPLLIGRFRGALRRKCSGRARPEARDYWTFCERHRAGVNGADRARRLFEHPGPARRSRTRDPRGAYERVQVRPQLDAFLVAPGPSGRRRPRTARPSGAGRRPECRRSRGARRPRDARASPHQNTASPSSTKMADSCASCRWASPYWSAGMVSRCMRDRGWPRSRRRSRGRRGALACRRLPRRRGRPCKRPRPRGYPYGRVRHVSPAQSRRCLSRSARSAFSAAYAGSFWRLVSWNGSRAKS